MYLAVSAVLAFGVITCQAQDDGRYRPGLYGDDGSYRPSNEGRYLHQQDNRATYNSDYNRQQSYTRNYAYRPSVTVVSPLRSQFQVKAAPAPSSSYYPQSSQHGERYARILKQDSDVGIDGYHYFYQTENNINAEESGKLESTATGPGIRARGYYSYVGNDGVTYRVDYTADENGFHPSGAHLPQLP